MRRTWAVARKELRQVARDPISLIMLLGVPAFMLVLYGYALDLSRCIGCRRCAYSCVHENNQSRDPQIHWIRVLRMEKDKGIHLEEAEPSTPRPRHLRTSGLPAGGSPTLDRQPLLFNDDVALLHLKTPRTNRLRFLAGQHVQLGGNHMPTGTQPIASCPCDDMNLHFQIPAVPGDDFSDYIFSRLKKNALVEIDGPGGDFILDENSLRAPVFIAWHTGFGPIRSLIEHAMALETAVTGCCWPRSGWPRAARAFAARR